MKTIHSLSLGVLMTVALSIGYAQSSQPNMVGEMPDHPHMAFGPGSNKPMVHPPIAVEMIGEMPHHPHVKPAPGSDKPIAPRPIESRNIGDALGYPFLPYGPN